MENWDFDGRMKRHIQLCNFTSWNKFLWSFRLEFFDMKKLSLLKTLVSLIHNFGDMKATLDLFVPCWKIMLPNG